ncbi:trehalose-phosphatase [Acinetobacter sp. A47]|uniref:trehalose-phosphatase n=1 Tax=Acinetobacter sp. A47 TaxID=1561217 RepID=UPI000570127A
MDNRIDNEINNLTALADLSTALKLNNNKLCLFLDIDGTLCAFQLHPEDCYIPEKTLNVIDQIIAKQIPVIAVTGRDIQSAQRLFEPIDLPIAALHGLEIYLNKQQKFKNKNIFPDMSALYNELVKACSAYPDLLIENKLSSVALHYRKAPKLEHLAKAIMLELQQAFPHLKLIRGKCVYELISAQANKGQAIKQLLNHFNQQDRYRPVFIGDDVTDEDGFEYVNQVPAGISIKVGQGFTQARYRLQDINQVHEFLEVFLQHNQNLNNNTQGSKNLIGEKTCLN